MVEPIPSFSGVPSSTWAYDSAGRVHSPGDKVMGHSANVLKWEHFYIQIYSRNPTKSKTHALAWPQNPLLSLSI